MLEKINLISENIIDRIIKIRREIHMRPELGLHEIETSKLVKKELSRLGIKYRDGINKTGIIADISGSKPGKCILLRADMDALQICEENNLDFRSKNPGLMHACGHDVHTSMLIGAAEVIKAFENEIKGTVRLCFQPNEETSPVGGAQAMIDDGILENPRVDAAVALHVWNFPVGTVAFRDGTMMAQSDRFNVKIHGKSAHAAQPQNGVDSIVVAANLINALQTVVSRNTDPLSSLVFTIGKIHGGSRYNVISDLVEMEGTVRILSEELIGVTRERLINITENICSAFGAVAEAEYTEGYAMTKNDKSLFELAKKSLQPIFNDNILTDVNPSSGGEDFSAFGKKVPILFMWLGMESEINDNGRRTLHNPKLIVDERCMLYGIKTLSKFALDYLNQA